MCVPIGLCVFIVSLFVDMCWSIIYLPQGLELHTHICCCVAEDQKTVSHMSWACMSLSKVRANPPWRTDNHARFQHTQRVSLPFAGIGCPDRAIIEGEWPVSFVNVIDERKCLRSVLEELHRDPSNIKIGNITDMPLPSWSSSTGICTGFPCTPFSQQGLEKGLNDDNCFLTLMLNTVKHLADQPYEPLMWMCLENVKQLVANPDAVGSPWQVIQRFFKKHLPHWTPPTVWHCNAKDYKTCQERHRVFIVSFHGKFADGCGGVPTAPATIGTAPLDEFLVVSVLKAQVDGASCWTWPANYMNF